MNFILVLMVSSNFVQVLTQWIDPHDLNTNSKQYLRKSSLGDVDETMTHSYESRDEEKTTLVYLKRVVSLILNSAVADGTNTKLRSGKYEFNTDSENYKFLSQFVIDQNINIESLRKLDSTLSDVFCRHFSDDIFDSLLTLQEKIFNLICTTQFALLFTTLLCLYVMYNLLQSNYTFWYIIKYFILIILVVDYGFRYRLLYEEAEEQNMKIQYSAKCDTKKMDWGTYLLFLMKPDECEQKYVMPLEVALFQLEHIIIKPMSSLGAGFGHFAKELWDKLPFPWNLLIFPIMLIFVIMMWAITTTTARGIPFKINLMHLFHFEFGKRTDDTTNRVSGSTLDSLLNVIGMHHRPMIENIRSSPKKRKSVREKKSSAKSSPEYHNKNSDGNGFDVQSNTDKTTDKTRSSEKREEKKLNQVNESSSESGSESGSDSKSKTGDESISGS